jgi:GcrA cell cycle regulator
MRGPPTSPWTAERVETVRAMRADGFSAGKIGKALGMSRNAVIGKCNRLGIAAPSTPWSMTLEEWPVWAMRAATMAPQPRSVASRPSTPPPALDSSGNVIRLDTVARTGQCRWPMWGDDERREFQVCGNVCPSSAPYCDAHRVMAFTPQNRRRLHGSREDGWQGGRKVGAPVHKVHLLGIADKEHER